MSETYVAPRDRRLGRFIPYRGDDEVCMAMLLRRCDCQWCRNERLGPSDEDCRRISRERST